MLEPTIEEKIQIIKGEIKMYENTKYLMALRYKVNKNIGVPPEQLQAVQDELVKMEQAIDLLGKELEALV